MATEGENTQMAPAERYRRRFERSVLGQHPLMPPTAQSEDFGQSHERINSYPCGPDTSFGDPTPMPFRFTDKALADMNQRHADQKPINPCYATTSSEIGRLPIEKSDLPMRYYPMDTRYTTKFFLGNAEPKTMVNTGLNTAIDRSFVHATMDQGWAGNLGLKHHNISSLSYARAAAREGLC